MNDEMRKNVMVVAVVVFAVFAVVGSLYGAFEAWQAGTRTKEALDRIDDAIVSCECSQFYGFEYTEFNSTNVNGG